MKKALFAVCSSILATPLALASDFYVSAGVGFAMFDDTADASRIGPPAQGSLPSQISIDGRPFDSTETAAGLTVGWHANDWLSVELGYTDFGNSGQRVPQSNFGFVSVANPVLLPPGFVPPILPPSNGFFPAGPIFPPPSGAALSVDQWSLAAKFRKHLVADLSANWSVGITRAQFEAEGRVSILQGINTPPFSVEVVNIPFASPGDETGYTYGFGFEWRFNDRFSSDIGYRRNDTGVIDVDTVMVQLSVAL